LARCEVHSRHLLSARFDGYPARRCIPRNQSSPLVGSSFGRGLGARGLFGFPLTLDRLTTRITSTMAFSPFKFLQEVRSETAKVTWPTRRETTITTIMVFVMVALASVFFFAADQMIRFLVTFLLGIH
jgi:preprotein translocase subunit SecE